MYKKNFDYIKIAIASPQKILEWSTRKNVFGLPELYEVLDASTFDFQTYKPEPDGLFCEKIFGTVKDNSCFCEEYTNVRLKKIICEIFYKNKQKVNCTKKPSRIRAPVGLARLLKG